MAARASLSELAQTLRPELQSKDLRSTLRIRQSDANQPNSPIFVVTLPEAKPEDDPFITDTTQFIKDRSIEFDKNIVIAKDLENKVIAWAGIISSNNTSLEEIKALKGIKEVFETGPGKKRLAMPKNNLGRSSNLERDTKLTKRFPGPSGWYQQEFPSHNLRVVSQFPGQILGPEVNYVYEKHGGAKDGGGVFIYIVENGIQLDAKTAAGPEFPNLDRNPDGSIKVIQTVLSRNNREDPNVDENAPDYARGDPGSHGTRVASLALGARYGTAKHATLVSVKTRQNGIVDDQADALQLVYMDIANNNRQDRAVVLSTIGDPGPSAPEARDRPGSAAQRHDRVIGALMDLGVPVITPSGNDRSGNLRANVDFWPSMWASPAYPLIVVGETNQDGYRMPVSQGGLQVTTWAPTENAICLNRDDTTEGAAGMVAGIVATFMAYDEEPWGNNLIGIERTKKIEQFLRSEPGSGYKRFPSGERVIWNGADKAAHDGAESDPNIAPTLSKKAISIVLTDTILQGKNRFRWRFYGVTDGQNGVCRWDDGKLFYEDPNEWYTDQADPNDWTLINPPWPGGTYNLTIWDEERCQFNCDGASAGSLSCPSFKKLVYCKEDFQKSRGANGAPVCNPQYPYFEHAVVRCEW